jgi:hypothetical protein
LDKDIRPVTGDYANPTGYVNLDLVQELASKPASQSAERASADEGGFDNEHLASPRIRRQEPVFSGTHRVHNKNRRARRDTKNDYEAEERRPRSLLLWTLGVGATTSFIMYVSGSVAEKAKAARLEREVRIPVPEKSGEGRWRLDEGVWKREG